ncbi:MAG: DNA translocase FtsK [Puniceicoccales bacterium]|nr:DNA translocase FtsK [Puniceicoccales bacterium]
MSSSKTRRSSPDGTTSVETPAFAPRRSSPRPVLAVVFFLLGALLTVALANYQSDQAFLFHKSILYPLAKTTALTGSNAMGIPGATLAVLLFHFAGLGAFFVPLSLFVAAWCALFNRAHTLFPWRTSLMAGAFIAAVTLLAPVDPGHNDSASLTAALSLKEFVPKGVGGVLGNFVYRDIASAVFGHVGTLVLFPLLYAFCLLGIFVDEPGKFINARVQVLRTRWKQYRDERRRRAEELQEFRRQRAEALASGKLKLQGAVVPKKTEAGESVAKPKRQEAAPAPVSTGTDDGETTSEEAEELENGGEADETEPSFEGEDEADVESSPPLPDATAEHLSGKFKIISAETIERAMGSQEPKKRGDYQFPPVALLKEAPPAENEPQENYFERAERLITTLAEFKIKAEMGEIQSGPVITRYEVIPAPGVRVEKIAGLANNLAMNLKAESVRVLAPVPGKGTVGIEVPNLKAKAVSLREIIESTAWEKNKHEIPIVLGKDVTGKPIIENLAKMPHCLIAGSTGSGKSVCINGIVASLVYHAGPEDLRFIMVDPKVVELQVYNKLPHMLIPVVTDPKKVPAALKYLIGEMERRYQIFAKSGVKNIAGFNAKLSKSRAEAELARQMDMELSPEERAATAMVEVPRDDGVLEIPTTKLPYIICFIDELADLMMVAPADIETRIARLAQLARAAGIHLILATQRPSVNVITGIIKANLPTRIAFKVTSQVDSRTILDQKGAESLIGRGDMLFIPPGSSHLVRAQGAYVSEEEIEALVEHLALCNGEPEFDDEVQELIDRMTEEENADGDMSPTDGTDDPNEDPMLAKAWEIIRVEKKASTSFLQRKLSIGYGRAAKIIDALEKRAYIGPDQGPGKPRDILRDL